MKQKSVIQYRVPYADTDQMGVVYYANYLVYFERLRTELLRESEASYKDIEENGVMLPVIEAICKYKKPAGYDDLLEISGWVEEIKGAKVKICCQVHKADELLAEGYTIHACVDTKTRRPVRAPQSLKDLEA